MRGRLSLGVFGAVLTFGCPAEPGPPRGPATPPPGPGGRPAPAAAWSAPPPPLPRYAPREDGAAAARLGLPRAREARPTPLPPPDGVEAAGLRAAAGLAQGAGDRAFTRRVGTHFRGGRAVRLLVETDKPLYRPGETIWVRAVEVQLQGNRLDPGKLLHRYELVDPRGAVAQRTVAFGALGHTRSQLDLPRSAAGGEYRLRVRRPEGGLEAELRVMVAVYQPPRIKKRLTFLRSAYGPGERAEALLTLHRATGRPLANQALQAVVRLGAKELKRWVVQTDAQGQALVAFELPRALAAEEGLLNVLVTEGGVTESIARPIPLAAERLEVGFFPEGGAAVRGLPSRIYVAARRARDGKPADLEGEIRDGQGQVVARLRTFHDGMGRFVYTPGLRAGRDETYALHVSSPEGVRQVFPLPPPRPRGVTLQLVDDFDSRQDALELVVHSTRAQRVAVTALEHETLVGQAVVRLAPGAQRVRLPLEKAWRGVVRLTLHDAQYRPLAERLVFRHRGRGLRIAIAPDRRRYEPRDTVTLRLRATAPEGSPVPGARLGVSVVDDTAHAFADDEEPHFLAQRFLTGQLTGRVHRPRFYFDPKEPKAARALDLVMGTHGWRGFVWADLGRGPARPRAGAAAAPRLSRPAREVPQARPPGRDPNPFATPGPHAERPRPGGAPGGLPGRAQARLVISKSRIVILDKVYFPPRSHVVPAPSRPLLDAIAAAMRQHPRLLVCVEGHTDDREIRGAAVLESLALRRAGAVRRYLVGKGVAEVRLGTVGWGAERPIAPNRTRRDRERNRRVEFRLVPPGERGRGCEVGFARRFPTRFYRDRRPADGVRRDFRETVFWDPEVVTDGKGEATVRFGLTDSVTSFRVRVSGVGAGELGLSERLIAATRPFHMVVKAPLAASEGDGVVLPLTLRNESARALRLRVRATLPPALALERDPAPGEVSLGPGRARTYYYPVRVLPGRGEARLGFHAAAAGLSDAFEHALEIAPRGLPRAHSYAGRLEPGRARTFRLTLPRDLRQASPDIRLQLYPHPLATVTGGLEGMLREPVGCFEQASSSNYPNVMVLRMLARRGGLAPALQQRAAALLEKGYAKLVSYETRSRGYEWFGASPGHEALSAYGLVQFLDMRAVHGRVDPAMVARTARWLLARRDGRGGYRRNAKALDRFGRASPEITAAYVTWGLAEAGQRGIDTELRYLAALAQKSRDPYLIALAVGALGRARGAGDPGAKSLARRLAALQQPDGRFPGRDHSITRSTGQNLDVETTALAVLALLRARGPADRLVRAVRWLERQRTPVGTFGATQATVLALRALVAHEEAYPMPGAPGEVVVRVNGREVDRAAWGARTTGAVTLTRFGDALGPGQRTVEVMLRSAKAVPFGLSIRYTTNEPASAPDAAVALTTRLERAALPLGETTRLLATVENRTGVAQPMVLLRLGLPGAFRPETWQLRALRDQGRVAAFETRAREVILYLRGLAPRARLELPIALVARVPGRYVGPPSAAYLYYADDKKTWAPPLVATVTP